MDQPKKKLSKKGKLQQLRDDLASQYGARKTWRYNGYADQPKEKPLVDLLKKYAPVFGFDTSYFFTIAIGEGLGRYMIDSSYDINKLLYYNKEGVLRTDVEVSGMKHLGLDDFSNDFSRMDKKYFSKDYNEGDEFNKIEGIRTNEYGRQKVNSAYFKNLDAAIQGFGGMLAFRRDLFVEHSRTLGYGTSTDDELAFWNYVYYQGEGRALRYLEHNNGFDYRTSALSTDGMPEVRELALERLATWRYVQQFNLF